VSLPEETRRAVREDVRRDVGEPSGFFEFKRHDELNPLWEAHGDPDVATWDMGRDSKPRAVAD